MTQRPELIKPINKGLRHELNSFKVSIREIKSMMKGYPTRRQRSEKILLLKAETLVIQAKTSDPYYSHLYSSWGSCFQKMQSSTQTNSPSKVPHSSSKGGQS